MLRTSLLLPAALSLLLASAVQASELSYAGVWQGSVGEHPAMVCFEPFGSSFYDQQTLYGLRLNEASSEAYLSNDGQPELVREWQVGGWNSPQGSWHIDEADARHIKGTWRSHDGKLERPIELTPMEPAPASGVCSHPTEAVADPTEAFLRYNGARIEAAQRLLEPDSFDGHDWTRMKTTGGSAPMLPEELPAAAAINQWTDAWLQTQTASAWDCEMGARSLSGQLESEPEWQRSLTPVLWNAHWLVLQDSLPSTFCGGAHDTSVLDWRVFDLASGQQVEILDWLVTEGEGVDRSISAELRKRIASKLETEGSECDNDYDITPFPQADGMAFHLSHAHVMRSCDSDVVIPWKDMQDQLTTAGQQAARTLGK